MNRNNMIASSTIEVIVASIIFLTLFMIALDSFVHIGKYRPGSEEFLYVDSIVNITYNNAIAGIYPVGTSRLQEDLFFMEIEISQYKENLNLYLLKLHVKTHRIDRVDYHVIKEWNKEQ